MSVTDEQIIEAMDEADRLLIATVDTAIEVGTGRTFETPGGHTVRVDEIGETWVQLEVMVAGIPVQRLPLPRKIREIAFKATRLRLEHPEVESR